MTYISLFIYPSPFLPPSHLLTVSLSMYVCMYVCLYVFMYISLSLSLSSPPTLFLFLFLFLFQFHSDSLFLRLSICLSLSLSLILSLLISLSLLLFLFPYRHQPFLSTSQISSSSVDSFTSQLLQLNTIRNSSPIFFQSLLLSSSTSLSPVNISLYLIH